MAGAFVRRPFSALRVPDRDALLRTWSLRPLSRSPTPTRATPTRPELMLEGVLQVGYACVLDLRKLNGKRRGPRLSVRAKDASRCSAVILPLVRRSSGQWVADRSVARPVLVPLLSLGRCVVASEGSGNRAGSFTIAVADQAAGGPELRTMNLSEDLFAAAAMNAVEKDLMEMKVTELKEELASRDEPVSGNKAWLRRRLHAAIVREHLEAASEE